VPASWTLLDDSLLRTLMTFVTDAFEACVTEKHGSAGGRTSGPLETANGVPGLGGIRFASGERFEFGPRADPQMLSPGMACAFTSRDANGDWGETVPWAPSRGQLQFGTM
jgi:hypothetical protein